MLTALRLENIALIETLELSFAGGFSVLTGETGAGKSILLDALDDTVEIHAAAHQEPAMLDHPGIVEARDGSARDAVQRLTRAVGNKVQVGVANGHGGCGSFCWRLGKAGMKCRLGGYAG